MIKTHPSWRSTPLLHAPVAKWRAVEDTHCTDGPREGMATAERTGASTERVDAATERKAHCAARRAMAGALGSKNVEEKRANSGGGLSVTSELYPW